MFRYVSDTAGLKNEISKYVTAVHSYFQSSENW